MIREQIGNFLYNVAQTRSYKGSRPFFELASYIALPLKSMYAKYNEKSDKYELCDYIDYDENYKRSITNTLTFDLAKAIDKRKKYEIGETYSFEGGNIRLGGGFGSKSKMNATVEVTRIDKNTVEVKYYNRNFGYSGETIIISKSKKELLQHSDLEKKLILDNRCTIFKKKNKE